MECHGKRRCTQVYRVFVCIFGARFRAVWAPSTAGKVPHKAKGLCGN